MNTYLTESDKQMLINALNAYRYKDSSLCELIKQAKTIHLRD